MSTVKPFGRTLAVAALATALAVGLTACSSSKGADTSGTIPVANNSTALSAVTVTVGAQASGWGTPTDIQVTPQADIIAKLPASVKASGKLTIGLGALPSGFPPLASVGDDNKTLTGSEPDLGRLVAAVFGLKPDIVNNTWDNSFVAIDSGKVDVGFSNITDTEQRKEKYDFASYRQDNLGFAVKATNSSFNFDKSNPTGYEALAGLKVAVGAGTNQEKILVAWQAKLKGEGKSLDIKYYADTPSTWTALNSGQIDAYFGPNPGIAYQLAKTQGTDKAIRDAGTFSGAGASLQGLIAATTKKDNGLAQPVADAINYLIKTGQYQTWLKAYSLESEAVDTSLVNPPGLPKSNS
jgi:polar amino acid transport system substrate-binding protein